MVIFHGYISTRGYPQLIHCQVILQLSCMGREAGLGVRSLATRRRWMYLILRIMRNHEILYFQAKPDHFRNENQGGSTYMLNIYPRVAVVFHIYKWATR